MPKNLFKLVPGRNFAPTPLSIVWPTPGSYSVLENSMGPNTFCHRDSLLPRRKLRRS